MAPFTCTTSRGSSTVDYILSSNITMRTHTNSDITRKLSDHALLCTHVHLTCPDLVRSDFSLFTLTADLDRKADDTPPHTKPEATTTQTGSNLQTPATPQTPHAVRKKRYTWLGGEDTIEYMRSAKIWKAHTSTELFATKFREITEECMEDNERRTEQVEAFLIKEAITAGVVQAMEKRQSRNPNQWAKHLAPWFSEICREAKREYRSQKRIYGKKHTQTKQAYHNFRRVCKLSRAQLSEELPTILKYKPK
jgi:hypothetical protein